MCVCAVLRCAALCCAALRCAALCCAVLPCAAMCCAALRCAVLPCAAMCCYVLCCAALCCNVLQCDATCCHMLCCCCHLVTLVISCVLLPSCMSLKVGLQQSCARWSLNACTAFRPVHCCNAQWQGSVVAHVSRDLLCPTKASAHVSLLLRSKHNTVKPISGNVRQPD